MLTRGVRGVVTGRRWRQERSWRPRLTLRRRFDAEQRPVVFVGDDVEQAVGALPHVADALVQLGQQRLAAQLFELVVEDDPFEFAVARNLAAARAPDEEVTLPGGQLVAGVEGQAG